MPQVDLEKGEMVLISMKSILELKGRLAVEVDRGLLCRIGLREEIRHPADMTADPVARQTMRQLDEYFRGERRAFDLPLDWDGMRPFQRKVLEHVYAIPFGRRRSYRWVAEQAGFHAAFRAVGRAIGTNPLPFVIPCHRVIRSDGGLGGYYFGLSCKEQLLEMESLY